MPSRALKRSTCACAALDARQRRPKERLWDGQPYRHEKMRLAYMSTDFRDHVVADMIVGCLEQHDRTRLDMTAISIGPDDGSAMRRRIAGAFDRFVDAHSMSDSQLARWIRELEIDVLVDLNGNSGENRQEILLYRPAPVQVSYLGYPGTTACRAWITLSRIAWSFLRNITAITASRSLICRIASCRTTGRGRSQTRSPSRLEAGLPEMGFVFACHNHEHKITPEIFDVWMRLLRAVEGSVIWLNLSMPTAVINLRREARARGVSAERLLFAPHVPHSSDHLARLRLADLFLDTLPYNAHATACDALWAGLPVVTCLGTSFPGRVAASLLHAIGLPELVTSSLLEYEALALELARDSGRLAALSEKLRRNRDTQPLFDTPRLTRHLEAAYATMWERQTAGLPAAAFSVED